MKFFQFYFLHQMYAFFRNFSVKFLQFHILYLKYLFSISFTVKFLQFHFLYLKYPFSISCTVKFLHFHFFYLKWTSEKLSLHHEFLSTPLLSLKILPSLLNRHEILSISIFPFEIYFSQKLTFNHSIPILQLVDDTITKHVSCGQ